MKIIKLQIILGLLLLIGCFKKKFENINNKAMLYSETSEDSEDEFIDANENLIEAAKEGDVEGVQKSLAQGAEITAEDEDGFTSMYLAAIGGHVDVIKCLIAAGANKNERGCSGETPLNVAVLQGQLNVVKYFVEELKVDVDQEEEDDANPLHWAAAEGHVDVIEYLIEAGADKNKKDYNAGTPLQWAAIEGQLEVVKYFVEKLKVDVNQKNEDGETLLHLAVVKRMEENLEVAVQGRLDVISYLIDRWGLSVDQQDKKGNTPLHGAVWEGQIDVGKLLVEKGAQLDIANNAGTTPLH